MRRVSSFLTDDLRDERRTSRRLARKGAIVLLLALKPRTIKFGPLI